MNVWELFAHPAWRPLVFALLHTLWQGAVLALLLTVTLRGVSVRRPEARYALALAAQWGVLLAGLVTWALLDDRPASPPTPLSAPLVDAQAGVSAPRAEPATSTDGPSIPLAPGHVGWVPWAALGWMAGVVIMLAHTTRSVLAAFRLTNGPRVRDRALLEIVDGLRRDLGLRRHVRVVSAGDLGPAVLGLLWPTIVLPIAFITGLPPEELRAILAHELAHIRRQDSLWNLGQLLVESLLFFNPVVWWLGRQVRIEREACCDAIAVTLTGRPLDYSRTLARWAERTARPAPNVAGLAWGGPRSPSLLRERIVRILTPSDQPRVRISGGGLLFLLLAGPIVLFGLQRGTVVAVKVAAQILAPAERLERLKVAQAEYAPPQERASSQPGKATLRGTIVTPNGEPLREPIAAATITMSRNSTTMSAERPLKEHFTLELKTTGSTYLSVEPKDYAPTFVGPLLTGGGETVEGITIVLETGFPARVRIVDENGTPVGGARIKGGLAIEGGSCSSSAGWITNDEGVAIVPHASKNSYFLTIDASGFQASPAKIVSLTPRADTTLTIAQAQPTTGIILTNDGEPVVGAKIKHYLEKGPSGVRKRGGFESPIATTDSAGRFVLDRLEDGAIYTFLIESDTHGRGIAAGVKAGQSGLRWQVGPQYTIHGTIKGDLAQLERDGGKPVVHVNLDFTIPNRRQIEGLSGLSWTVPVEPTESGGTFRITGLLPGKALLKAGTRRIEQVVERPNDTVTIDLTQPSATPSTCRVVLRLVTPDGAVRPSGFVESFATPRAPETHAIQRSVPIEDGKVVFDAPAPARVRFEPQWVVGYWFEPMSFEVAPETEPKYVEVPCVPAGAIVGQVLDFEGNPSGGRVRVSYATVQKPPALQKVSFPVYSKETDAQGRFFLSPLPIGGTYIVVASHGHNRQLSRPVELAGEKATERVELRLSKPVSASGRVVGPDGRPLPGIPVTLNFSHPQASMTWGPPTLTDRSGRFQFDGLGSGTGPYQAVLDLRKDYQPINVALNPGGALVDIALGAGHVIEGRVLDAATGRPIPGVEMYAHRPQWRPAERYAFEAEGRTDADGRFRFSNLPDQPVSLNDRSGLGWQSPAGSRVVEPDQAATVEIRATLPSWSPLKPAGPAAK